MDEWLLSWYYAHWIEDQEEEISKMKNFGIFVGAFSNPEMASQIRDSENNTTKVSDEDMDKSLEYMKQQNENTAKLELNKKRRRRFKK